MDEHQVEEGRYSRLKALKYFGVGAATTWAVPAIMTGTAEAAKGGKTCAALAIANGSGCGDIINVPIQQCGTAGPLGASYCYLDAGGCCFCGWNQFCADSAPCATKRDCPAGYDCAVGTACGASGICIKTAKPDSQPFTHRPIKARGKTAAG